MYTIIPLTEAVSQIQAASLIITGGSIRGNTVIRVKYSEWWNAYAENVDGCYSYYCPVTVTSSAVA